MKELYERKDAERILDQAIRDVRGKEEFCRLHGVSGDVDDLLRYEKVLAILNLRRVDAFERIEK